MLNATTKDQVLSVAPVNGPAEILRMIAVPAAKTILLLVLFDPDTHSTAAVLGIAPATVMAHLSRAADEVERDLPGNHRPMTVERNPRQTTCSLC
jgi:hypothetical protein